MTRFVSFASAAALLAALTGCGAEPVQKSETAPGLAKVPAGEPVAEAIPSADAEPIAPELTLPEAAMPPEKPRLESEPKVAVPPQPKPAPEAPKPAEPDPHAGHDLD